MYVYITGRHHCFKSATISKGEGGQVQPNTAIVLESSRELSDTKGGLVGAKVSYREEHALDYHNHSSKTCHASEALTSTTIFKKCGVETSS